MAIVQNKWHWIPIGFVLLQFKVVIKATYLPIEFHMNGFDTNSSFHTLINFFLSILSNMLIFPIIE